MRPLQYLPPVAVTGAVVQMAIVPDRPPAGFPGRQQDAGGLLHLIQCRAKGGDDRRHLHRMDAPLALVAEVTCGTLCITPGGLTVTDGQRDAVHGHLAMGMCRQGDVGQRPGQQRVFELPTAMQGITAHGAAEAAHVIHQSEAQRLHPRVGRDGIEPGQRRR